MKNFFVGVCLAVGLIGFSAHAEIAQEGITPTTPQPAEGPPPTVPASRHKGLGLMFESAYGFSSVSPTSMNSALNAFQWAGGVIAPGGINDLQYLAVGVGYRFLDRFYIVARYEQSEQAMGPVVITPITYSVSNAFYYNPIYLLLDGYLYRSGLFYVSGIAGVGYALKYELHQTENPGEDVTWQANPWAFRLGSDIGLSFADNFDLFADIFYESVSSKLTAETTYGTKFAGNAITQGQFFTNQNSGAAVNVNMSGWRYGLGVRLRF